MTFVQAMDWDQDGVPELVMGTAVAIHVQNWAMTPLFVVPLPPVLPLAPTPRTCVSHSGPGGDLLVIVHWNGQHTIVSWMSATTSGSLTIGSQQAGPIATYDRDGDGDEDLLIGDATRSLVHVLTREHASFTLQTAALLTGTATPDAGIGAIAGADIDGDGDGDIVAFNRSSLNTHTVFDGLVADQRLRHMAADVEGLTSTGGTTTLPIHVGLPSFVAQPQQPASTLRLAFDGWLADRTTGLVWPERVLSHDIPLDPMQVEVSASLTFPWTPSASGTLRLQISAGIVVVDPSGARRRLPTTLLHVTNDPMDAIAIAQSVETERTGNYPTAGKDGGGDGNIIGAKTGKHEVGMPPR